MAELHRNLYKSLNGSLSSFVIGLCLEMVHIHFPIAMINRTDVITYPWDCQLTCILFCPADKPLALNLEV